MAITTDPKFSNSRFFFSSKHPLLSKSCSRIQDQIVYSDDLRQQWFTIRLEREGEKINGRASVDKCAQILP